ncbi:MAG: 50S ribosomal protein L23 [Candidatus Babeliales bacterium]
MDLNIFDIIIGPVVSDKAYRLNKTQKKLALLVHPQANKPLIKKALQRLFDVQVEDVRIVVRKGKIRRAGRREVQGTLTKKAIVTLAKGYSLDLFDQGGSSVVAEKHQAGIDQHND